MSKSIVVPRRGPFLNKYFCLLFFFAPWRLCVLILFACCFWDRSLICVDLR